MTQRYSRSSYRPRRTKLDHAIGPVRAELAGKLDRYVSYSEARAHTLELYPHLRSYARPYELESLEAALAQAEHTEPIKEVSHVDEFGAVIGVPVPKGFWR